MTRRSPPSLNHSLIGPSRVSTSLLHSARTMGAVTLGSGYDFSSLPPLGQGKKQLSKLSTPSVSQEYIAPSGGPAALGHAELVHRLSHAPLHLPLVGGLNTHLFPMKSSVS